MLPETRDHDAVDYQPFLDDQFDQKFSQDGAWDLKPKGSGVYRKILGRPLLLIINFILLVGNGVFFAQTQNWVSFHKQYCPDLPFAPQDTGFKYENTMLYSKKNVTFESHLPNKLARITDGLLFPGTMRVSKAEMEHFGELGPDSITLENGGYLGAFRVAHEIHCLYYIKFDYGNMSKTYPPEFGADYRQKHFDHCIHMMRQNVQCRGDLTTNSWYLDEDMSKPVVRSDGPMHTCIDWSSVENWMIPRLLERDTEHDGPFEHAVGPYGNPIDIDDWIRFLKPT